MFSRRRILGSVGCSGTTSRWRMIDLKGKHIFIAGGSRGIGRATALMAARGGANVTVNFAQNGAAAEGVTKEIQGIGPRAAAVQADISEEGQADRAVDTAAQRLGPLDGVVISAGMFEASP